MILLCTCLCVCDLSNGILKNCESLLSSCGISYPFSPPLRRRLLLRGEEKRKKKWWKPPAAFRIVFRLVENVGVSVCGVPYSDYSPRVIPSLPPEERKKERKNNTTTWRSRKDFPSYGWSQAGSRPESRKVSPGVVPPRPSPCSFHCSRGPTQSVSNTHNGLTSGSWPSFYSSSSSIVWWLEKWKKNCRRTVGRSVNHKTPTTAREKES